MRVLFVCCNQPGHVVFRYRCQHLAETLVEAGHEADVVYVGDSRVRVAQDMVVLHRICDVWEGRQFARAARAIGATLVYAADDLVWEADALTHPGMAKMRDFAPRHVAMMRQSDAILMSTEYLADHATPFVTDKPILVQRNFLGREQMQLCDAARQKRAEQAERDGIVFGYFTGTATHDADLAAIAEPLVAVLKSHPKARLLLVGPVTLPGVLDSVREQVEQRSLLPWRDVPGVLAETDVNIAPLALDRSFNHGKSVIKFLEAGACEVPTIASASAEFRAVVSPGRNCLLCETPADWANALLSLIENAEFRHRIAAAAHNYAVNHATPDAHRDRLAALFDRLLSLQPVPPTHHRSRHVNWPFAPKYAVKRVLGGILRR